MTQSEMKELRNCNNIEEQLTEILGSKTQGLTNYSMLFAAIEDFGQFLKDNFSKKLYTSIINPRIEFLSTHGVSTKDYHSKFEV